MVTSGPRGRRGSTMPGCLVSLALFVAAIYYGINIGNLYWKFYQLKDEMTVQARVAPGITDDVIRRRLVQRVDELLLPNEAKKFRIRRLARPPKIEIETEYRDSVDLFLLQRGFTFKPKVEAPL